MSDHICTDAPDAAAWWHEPSVRRHNAADFDVLLFDSPRYFGPENR